MRKTLSVILVLLLCLSFSSCNKLNFDTLVGESVNKSEYSQSVSKIESEIIEEPEVSENSQNSVSSEVSSKVQMERVPEYVTVNCYSCSGFKKCAFCRYETECLECGGYGKTRCWDCLGDGECISCSGDGGSYEYNFYKGESEWKKCTTCYGNRMCRGCSGRREVTCRSCGGVDKVCSYCYGSTVCSVCNGLGTITQLSGDSFSNSLGSNVLQSETNITDNDYQLIADINGIEYGFELSSASVKDDKGFKYINAKYQAFDTNGKLVYNLYIAFDLNLTCGTYDIIGDNYAPDLGCTVEAVYNGLSFHSTRLGKEVKVGVFTITDISSEELNYEGYFNAELMPSGGSVVMTVDVSRFEFTLE